LLSTRRSAHNATSWNSGTLSRYCAASPTPQNHCRKFRPLIAEAGLEAPDTYRDAFAILTRHGVLDDELGKRLQSWAGMRNVLAHLYLDIDHGITWDAIRNDLGDLRRLAEIAAAKL
jgi:hypothetical protein